MSNCTPRVRAWSPIWYKLDCNDITFTSSNDSIAITRLSGECCGWDLQATGGGGTGSVTSVGLTMPAAFSVINSPVTSTGTLAVTAIGTALQYIRGDGALATLPVYTANNGLTLTGTNLQWGGTLLSHTTVDSTASYESRFTGAAPLGSGLYTVTIKNTALFGNALRAEGMDGGIGIEAVSSTGYAANITSGSGPALQASTGNNTAIIANVNPSSTNSTHQAVNIIRTTSGTPSNGIGLSVDLSLETTVQARVSTQLVSRLTDVTDATRTSQFEIWGTNNANVEQQLTIKGTGQHQLNKYGVGTFTGTPVYSLQVDASGNIIEGSTGSFYTTNGNLTSNRVVDGDTFSLTFTDVSLLRIVTGNGTIGGTFDFTNGVDLLAFDATNSSNLVLDPISGLDFQYVLTSGPTVLSSLRVGPTGVRFTGVQEFADNAAAIVGGLTAGYIYRTGDALKIVH